MRGGSFPEEAAKSWVDWGFQGNFQMPDPRKHNSTLRLGANLLNEVVPA